MARNINARLNQLEKRRKGLDRSNLTVDEVLARAHVVEEYQKRTSQPYTKYTLGAMQEVGQAYTEIGLHDARRVGRQLEKRLARLGIGVSFELQGSVPLNIHIKGVSDVDLLTLHKAFFTYDPAGQLVSRYKSPYQGSIIGSMHTLRTRAERVLSDAYPEAEIDISGAKAISISGGSLRRSIDVVPSHWHNTAEYQTSGAKIDRGVKIFIKYEGKTFLNSPFKHIHLVHTKDIKCVHGLKKAIRLCKSVKSDAQSEGATIGLSSFDIAGLMYYADERRLAMAQYAELGILVETGRHLDHLATNMVGASNLLVPDGSRKILDTAERKNGLIALNAEIQDLISQVTQEQITIQSRLLHNRSQINEELAKVYIP